MSGLEVLGAAAAVAQFVDYGIKLTKKAVEVYHTGQTKPTEELTTSTEEFQAQNHTLLKRFQGGGGSDLEKSIEETAYKCDQVSRDILVELQRLHVDARHKSAWKSLQVAFKSDKDDPTGKVQVYGRRLEALRKQLNEKIVQLLSEQQSDVQKTLSRMERNSKDLEADLSMKFVQYKNEILKAIESGSHGEVHWRLYDLQKEGQSMLMRQQILTSIQYNEQRFRHDDIVSAEFETYEWAFEEGFVPTTVADSLRGSQQDEEGEEIPPVHFAQWLQEDNGVYWIEGKPGCGKSTLMKYIFHHRKTQNYLRKWARGRRLITASHYFWIAGGPMQRSIEGLLRSLLWDILRQCPELIEYVCASRWGDDAVAGDARSMPWTLSDLRECVDSLASGKLSDSNNADCFCVFVDGLDEYEAKIDEHVHMVQLFCRLASASNVKVCISSRGWEVFKAGFAHSIEQERHLVLHFYTKDDIATVVYKHLEHYIQDRKQDDRNRVDLLVKEIIEKAEGVFLWVRMVIRELVDGFTHEDEITLLRDRLEKIPGDLETYFERIFNSVPEIYQQKGARILKACLAADEPLPLHSAIFLESDDPRQKALDMPLETSFGWFDLDFATRTRKQINGRCRDLLMVNLPPENSQEKKAHRQKATKLYRISFIHRTTQDWLQQKKLSDINERAGQAFDVSETLFATYVFLIKKAPSLAGLRNWREVVTDWSTHAFNHANNTNGGTLALKLIRGPDTAMTAVFERELRSAGLSNKHWSNLVVRPVNTPSQPGVEGTKSEYPVFEKGQRDLLGHAIEIGLFWYAKAEFEDNPSLISSKDGKGRPYFDYALRYCPTAMYRGRGVPKRYHPTRQMVQLFIEAKCDVNQQVWTQKGRILWDLFLAFTYDQSLSMPEAREVVWMLIRSGAQDVPRCEVFVSSLSDDVTSRYQNAVSVSKTKTLSMKKILTTVFGEDEAEAMCEAVSRHNNKGWLGFLWAS